MRPEPLRASLPLVLACSLASGACWLAEPPDAGTLDAVYAAPAEAVEVHSIASGQTLGALLYRAVRDVDHDGILRAFGLHASARRIQQNSAVTLRYLAADGSLRSVDVEVDADETVRVRRGLAGWDAEKIHTPIYVDTLVASGEIESSLWTSVYTHAAMASTPRNDRAEIIGHLDAVFQWQMDFSRQIRPGDTYRFAFEREVRPDGSIRGGRLLSAEFVNAGTAYTAIWFDPNDDGQGSYFDVEGKSVRRSFLLNPIEYRRISSRFNPNRRHPILNTIRAHRGVDYAADTGTPVRATADGVVIQRGRNGGLGNAVEIRHPNAWVTRYAHLSQFRRGVVVGTRVRQGDVIGYVGMTGLANGPHLHYEMMLRGGRHVDPLSVNLPAGDPVPADARVRWLEEMTARVALLESVPGAGPVRTASTAVVATESQEGSDD